MKFIITHALTLQSIISKLTASDQVMEKLEQGLISEDEAEKDIINMMAELSKSLLKMLPNKKRLEIIDSFK